MASVERLSKNYQKYGIALMIISVVIHFAHSIFTSNFSSVAQERYPNCVDSDTPIYITRTHSDSVILSNACWSPPITSSTKQGFYHSSDPRAVKFALKCADGKIFYISSDESANNCPLPVRYRAISEFPRVTLWFKNSRG
jgi:hypothetical protein